MVLIVFLNVILRYFFHSGLTWSEELARYQFVWVVFLGAILAYKDKGHLAVDLLVGVVPKRLQKVLFLLSNAVIIAVLVLLIHGLVRLIYLSQGTLSPALEMPVNILSYAGLLACFCMAFMAILQTIQFVFLDKSYPPWVKQ